MERLRELRKNMGISMKKLGEIIGVAESTISLYETGKREPDNETLIRLANYFDVTVDYLLGRTIPKDAIPVDESDFVQVPILGSVRAGADGIVQQEIIGYESTMRSSVRSGESYFWLEVKGDSMYPVFQAGDFVLVKRQTSVDSGTYAVVIVNGEEGLVKKVVYGPDWIELHSVNPFYPVRRFEGPDVLQVYVCGKVIEMKRRVGY
ncbi:MAG TPA: XRE family transcriptional regulator [Clostridia bacterium]|nr:XRE family transcriptional regulator [Clostridia bacterium]